MSLSLTRLQRIATEVAAELDPALDVSVARTTGDSDYAELLLTLSGRSEPCQTVVGLDREQSEADFRVTITERLGTQLDALRAQQL